MEYQPYITLLIKQFGAALSSEEQALLDCWLAASPKHQAIADAYRRAWEAVPEEDPEMPEPDIEQALLATRQKIAAQAPPQKAPMLRLPYWTRIAAGVAVLLVAMVVVRYNFQPAYITLTSGADVQTPFYLPDGSAVWLREGSTLRYRKAMEGTERLVELTGEAYFEVVKNPTQPFRVIASNHAEVKVLGTAFNVKAKDDNTAVTVKSGLVRFTAVPQQESVALQAGQRAVYDPHSAKVSVTSTTNFNDLAWQRGGLMFEETPLREVIADLESYYKVSITLENSTLEHCRYSYPLVTLPVEKVLENLCRTYQMQLNNPAANQFILTGGTCL